MELTHSVFKENWIGPLRELGVKEKLVWNLETSIIGDPGEESGREEKNDKD